MSDDQSFRRARFLLLALSVASALFVAYALVRMAANPTILASRWALWALSPYVAVALLTFALRGRVSWWLIGANALALGIGPLAHATMMARPDPFDGVAAMFLPLYQGAALFVGWVVALIAQARAARRTSR
jgi:hypothetical protein